MANTLLPYLRRLILAKFLAFTTLSGTLWPSQLRNIGGFISCSGRMVPFFSFCSFLYRSSFCSTKFFASLPQPLHFSPRAP